MDAGVAQACKASELARDLSDTEIFLLIESESFPKSGSERAFSTDRFSLVSIRKRVGDEHAVAKAVDGLLRKKFLEPFGDLVQATTKGNTVKHAFHDVRAAMSLTGINAAETRSVAFVSKMRKEMQRICKRNEAQD